MRPPVGGGHPDQACWWAIGPRFVKSALRQDLAAARPRLLRFRSRGAAGLEPQLSARGAVALGSAAARNAGGSGGGPACPAAIDGDAGGARARALRAGRDRPADGDGARGLAARTQVSDRSVGWRSEVSPPAWPSRALETRGRARRARGLRRARARRCVGFLVATPGGLAPFERLRSRLRRSVVGAGLRSAVGAGAW